MKNLTFIFLLINCAVSAQTRTDVDSMVAALGSFGNDTSRVQQLDLISFTYSRINPDKGLEYARQALDLSEQLGWKKGIAAANSDLAINYEAKGIHSLAIYHHQKALDQYTDLGLKRSMAAVLANMSTVYERQSDYPNALSYAHQALKISEELGDTVTAAIIWENIATIYMRQKNYTEAMQNYTTALLMYEKAGNSRVAQVLGNMGIVLDAMGRYDTALVYHFRALEDNRAQGDKYGEQVNLMNIGLVYCHMRDYDRALQFQLEALHISEESGRRGDIAINLGNIGETYYFMATDSSISDRNSLPTAIRYLEQAVGLCKEINYQGPLMEFAGFLSDAYALDGNYKDALAMVREIMVLKDSMHRQEQSAKIVDLEAKRDLLVKEKEIEIQNKQLLIAELTARNKRNERILYLSGIIFLVFLITILIARYRRKVKHHQAVLSDIADIQSHELRAPIARMQGLVKLLDVETADPKAKTIIGYIHDVSIELDDIVRKAAAKTHHRK